MRMGRAPEHGAIDSHAKVAYKDFFCIIYSVNSEDEEIPIDC